VVNLCLVCTATLHRADFNIGSMLACARKGRCHTAPDTEKQPEPKKQPQKQTVLWCRRNRHTHIKTKNRSTDISLEKMSPCSACDNQHNQKALFRTKL